MNHFAILLFLAACTPAAADESLVIARGGVSDCVIVLPRQPSAVQQTAARELQEHLFQATGAKLAIRTEGEAAPDKKQITVGASERMKRLLPGLNVDSLGHDGIVIKTAGGNLVLAGREPRGTLYAVYTFLEDVVGCRWWTSEESFIPKRPTLEVPALDIVYAPPLRYREAYYRDALKDILAARLKCNGNASNIPAEYGGHYRFAGFVHTFYPLLPPEKYFAAHPEWYSEIDGRRTTERAQLCLTNEEMRKELVQSALARLRAEPEAGIISISQNDWHGQCQCAKCRAVEEEEGSPSGPLLRFVNAVAADIEKEFPDVLVETLAYQYTRQTPKQVRPRRNVIIRLCSIECSFVQPLGEGPQNEAFRRDIEGWSRIAPQLFVWDYVTNFSNYLIPHPNLRVLAPNIRFFVDHKVVGLFEQGDAQSSVGDFVRMRAWLLAHLMWNPRADENALMREFMTGYYGPAAPHLTEYLDLVCDAAEQSGVYLRCFMSDNSAYLGVKGLNEMTRLFEKAEAAVAGDPVLARRVRRERMPLDHVWLARYHTLKRAARAKGVEFLGPKDPAAACEEFIRLAHEWNVGNWRERIPFAEYEQGLRDRFRPAVPPEMCKGIADDEWIDFQDSQFRMGGRGEWGRMVDDPAASDGRAAWMPGTHRQWALQLPLSDDLAAEGPWHCYAMARVESKAATGPAMSMGIYDTRAKKGVVSQSIAVQESMGKEYRLYDIGTHSLHGGLYFWAAPPERAEITGVYVDRVFIVREKK